MASTEMEDIQPTNVNPAFDPAPPPPNPKLKRAQKATEIRTFTIRTPAHSYAHLELQTSTLQPRPLDALQARTYCAAALARFQGDAGAVVPVDVLKVEGSQCWVRVPRPDMGAFASAVTTWPGTVDGGVAVALRVVQCSDWLGSMIGSGDQRRYG